MTLVVSNITNAQDWYDARAEVLQTALDTGNDVFFMAGNPAIYYKPHGHNTAFEADRPHRNGLFIYVERLINRHGHVYVPPLAWVRSKQPTLNNPTIPLVAAYSNKALQTLKRLDGPLGLALCQNGYDSFTLQDYFYRLKHGVTVSLDEHGTHTSWSKAYERAITSVSGL